jgi:rare lipoprotein A
MPRHSCCLYTLAALAAGLVPVQAQNPAPAAAAEQGIASWYGAPFEGQRSASGEIYHQEQLTAAHRTLAFGTKVRVRRLDSGQSVIVRITDRGPFVASRIIDLSYAAARGLGMTHPGLVAVAVDILESPALSEPSLFAVQAGTFRNPENARRTMVLMQQRFGAARMMTLHGDEDLYVVIAGAASTPAAAATLAQTVQSIGAAYKSALVVRVDSHAANSQVLARDLTHDHLTVDSPK